MIQSRTVRVVVLIAILGMVLMRTVVKQRESIGESGVRSWEEIT